MLRYLTLQHPLLTKITHCSSFDKRMVQVRHCSIHYSDPQASIAVVTSLPGVHSICFYICYHSMVTDSNENLEIHKILYDAVDCFLVNWWIVFPESGSQLAE